jgi:hypothetical protein
VLKLIRAPPEKRQRAPLRRLLVRIGEAQIGEALEEGAERHLRFEARERRADAQMRAAAEGHMRRILARDVEACGSGNVSGSRLAPRSDRTSIASA